MIAASSPPGETAASSDSTLVRARERDSGDERPESLPLRRLARRGQSAHRPTVEAALERDDAGAARRLACHLERGLVRLGTGVAEERLRTTHAFGQETREPDHGLGPVEIRRVPELVQLRVRRRGHGGMPMAEPDDGDPPDEVEVRTTLVVPDATAVSSDDRHVCARVRRKQCLPRCLQEAVARVAHPGTSVAPIDAWTPPRAARMAAISLGTIPPSKRPSWRPASASSAGRTTRDGPVEEHARDIAHEDDALCPEPERKRRRGLVGVDVERPFGQRRDDRDPPCGQRIDDRRGRRRQRVADESELLDAPGGQPDLVTAEPDRARTDRSAHFRVDCEERLRDDVEDVRCGDPPPGDERGLDSTTLHRGRDLRPGAVDDHDVATRIGDRRANGVGSDTTAQLHDDRHVVYSALSLT